jgi:TPR repeat protein
MVSNPPEAIRLFQLSADQGYAVAQHNLGVCYMRGTGIEKNVKQAINHFRLAGRQGYPEAITALAATTFLFYQGKIDDDTLNAYLFRLNKIAADSGNQEAQDSVEMMNYSPVWNLVHVFPKN